MTHSSPPPSTISEALNSSVIAVGKFLRQLFSSFIPLGLMGGIYCILKWLEGSASLLLSILFLLLLFGLLIYLNRQFYKKGGAAQWVQRLYRLGAFLPFTISYLIVFASAGTFALLVIILPHDDFFASQTDPSLAQVADVFLYHFMEMVPLIQFNDTIHWQPALLGPGGLNEASGASKLGWLIIAFRLLTAAPIIAVLKEYFSARKNDTVQVPG